MFSDLIYISIVSLENPLDHAEKCIYMNNVTISKIKERTFCKTDRGGGGKMSNERYIA